jgi:hypothetical protein
MGTSPIFTLFSLHLLLLPIHIYFPPLRSIEDGEVKGLVKGHSKSVEAIRRSWLSRQGLLHGC